MLPKAVGRQSQQEGVVGTHGNKRRAPPSSPISRGLSSCHKGTIGDKRLEKATLLSFFYIYSLKGMSLGNISFSYLCFYMALFVLRESFFMGIFRGFSIGLLWLVNMSQRAIDVRFFGPKLGQN